MSETAYLPIIDLGLALQGDYATAGAQIGHAFTTSGFCYVRNHGIPDELIERVRHEAMDFFHAPMEEKLACKPKEAVRGFNALNRTIMYGADNPDYKEFFQIGLELPPDDPAVLAGQPLRGPNQWPAGRPAFRTAMMDYFNAVGVCGQALLRSVACSLGIAPDFFVGKYDRPLQRTQAIWYPPHPPEREHDQFGVAPHTDYGCITLLWQDGVGGLDVQGADGNWIPAPPIPGTLVINIGDLLCRWSNNRYHSNMHRVTNRSGKERLSIATFYDPDYDAIVDPRDLNLPEGTKAFFEPVSAGDYIIGRIRESQKPKAEAS
ncbi:isopenicillin N synthase family oxygenase [Acetobacter sp. TBRC 12305]|uniref:2-oxoglutarate-dependent ethylene/succinate-forming enzyme n=1 Tax=Acetobacter garciniae TaxID=2817435 RepID=A0A939HHI3_9PROT|nr:2-oxoglutarate and iron-dependent oxygenase domain-containing protein [Acetobacter garciniae]MBO1324508.1 isopenicillin N synthase family oxygenase [Acetobacter garciniae]MBX0344197.1 isopenicillin N synthase family oxygenase [Acetobacter garciniae]